MGKHEKDSYCVRIVPTDKEVYAYATCSVFKALVMFVYLNFKYKKHTIEFRHYRYY